MIFFFLLIAPNTINALKKSHSSKLYSYNGHFCSAMFSKYPLKHSAEFSLRYLFFNSLNYCSALFKLSCGKGRALPQRDCPQVKDFLVSLLLPITTSIQSPEDVRVRYLGPNASWECHQTDDTAFPECCSSKIQTMAQSHLESISLVKISTIREKAKKNFSF